MQGLSEDERRAVLGEVLADELKAITEYVKDIPSLKQDMTAMKENMAELKSDMKIVKVAITDISQEQKGYERRLSHIEAA